MILLYISASVILAAALVLNRNFVVNRALVVVFLCMQSLFTIHQFFHRNEIQFGFFMPDALALLLTATLSIIAIPALFHHYDYIYAERDNSRTRGIYTAAMILLIMSLTAAYHASHIAVTWIFVEITTLSASAIIFHRRNAGSIEATWKYIFVSSISLVLVFIGILFLGISLGHASEDKLHYADLVSLAPTLDPRWLKLAFVFIFTGYTTKLGLVPLYTAGIDAKDKAPTPGGALFSSVVMNVGFTGVFRFYQVIAHSSVQDWANHVIIIAAGLSVFVAAVYMVRVRNIKRMLAYSSIEHMGLVMLGIAMGGVGYYAAVLHLVLHSFAKSSLFFQIGHLYKTYKTKNIYNIGNYFHYNPAGAVFILLAFISVTAMPPSGLFISELFIFKSFIEAGYALLLIPILLLLTIIIWAFGRSVLKILFTPPVGFDESVIEPVYRYETMSQYVLLSLVIIGGIAPPRFFTQLIEEVVMHLS